MTRTADILISVILPVYNGARYLKESVGSLLTQTHAKLELIIINDGSTDHSASIVREMNDPRIRYYEQPNQGLAVTLNRGIQLARGDYIARQDHDDFSLPERLEREIDFLEANPSHGMVGTWAEIRTGEERSRRAHRHPVDSLILKFELLFNNPFVHSSMMIRSKVFETVGAYTTDDSRQPPEDYELWSRIAREYEVANLPQMLHVYREVEESVSRKRADVILDHVIDISAENMRLAAGREVPIEDCVDASAILNGAFWRLSRRPSFRGMAAVIYAAADALSDSAGVRRHVLRYRARQRFRSIRVRYLKHRYGGPWRSVRAWLHPLKKRLSSVGSRHDAR